MYARDFFYPTWSNIKINLQQELSQLTKLMPSLHSITVRVCNIRKQKLLQSFTNSDAQEFFENSSPALRALQVSARKWEASFLTSPIIIFVNMQAPSRVAGRRLDLLKYNLLLSSWCRKKRPGRDELSSSSSVVHSSLLYYFM